MRLARLLCIAGVVLFSAAWAQADTIPGHFFIDLNDGFSLTNDLGGWGAGNPFTDSVNTGTSTHGFTNNFTAPCGDNEQDCEERDPYILVNGGGHSDPFGTSFSADANGGGILNFFNGGSSPITDILIVTTFVPGETYQCKSDIFAFCGFKDPPTDNTLYILFSKGTIPVATPEPVSTAFVLIGCAALVAGRRIRSRKAA